MGGTGGFEFGGQGYTMQLKLALNLQPCLHLLSDGITAMWRHALLGESFKFEWLEAESNEWREAAREGREREREKTHQLRERPQQIVEVT